MTDPYYRDEAVTLHHGNCIEVMRAMPEASVDSVVTDPPYGLRFMNATWDEVPPGQEWAAECLRVLKPGGHLLAFGGTRTWHRLAVAVEDAGFELRDSVAWLYSTGLPKTKGTLKPAFEPIVVARKPFTGTVAANVRKFGTGVLNVDVCRVAHASEADLAASLAKNPGRAGVVTSDTYGAGRPQQSVNTDGRWPTNVVLDGSQAEVLDGQNRDTSRYFPTFKYSAKAPASERPKVNGVVHNTVKPLGLMRWLVRLATPPGGVVLDTFAGSGTTAEACVLEGLKCVVIEREADYLPLVVHRLTRPHQGDLISDVVSAA